MTKADAVAVAVGVLPSWDLADLYNDPGSEDLQRDVSDAAAAAKLLAKTYQGHVGTLAADDFSKAIKTYESIHEGLGRVASYAQLLHAGDLTDPTISKFSQDIREQLNDISTDLIFFTLERQLSMPS
jgi:oligoendopeptidase F